MPDFAAGPRRAAIQAAIEEQGAAQDLAGIDHREVSPAPPDTEPPVSHQQSTRVVIDAGRKTETRRQVRTERKAIEDGREVDRDDRSPIGVDHPSRRHADAERWAMRKRQGPTDAADQRVDDGSGVVRLGRDGHLERRMDVTTERDEARLHLMGHQQHGADRLCVSRKPERPGRLAAPFARPDGVALDEQPLIDKRLDDPGNRRAVHTCMTGQFGAAGGAKVEQSLKHSPAIDGSDGGRRNE